MTKLFKKRGTKSSNFYKRPGRIRFALYYLLKYDKNFVFTLKYHWFHSIIGFLSFHLKYIKADSHYKAGSRNRQLKPA